MAAELGDVVRSIDIHPFMVLPAGRDKLVKTFVRQARIRLMSLTQCPLLAKNKHFLNAATSGVYLVTGARLRTS